MPSIPRHGAAGPLRRFLAVFVAFQLLWPHGAHSAPPPDRLRVLQRGVAITSWFRFPPNTSPAALRAYLSDAAMADLHRAGFSFIRLPVQPEFLLAAPDRLRQVIDAIRRLQRAALGVVVDAHPTSWHLETNPADRAALANFWRLLAPALRRLDPRLTFPELLNEPVFPHAAAEWSALQADLLQQVRVALPDDTIILTGYDWGTVGGLAALEPVTDTNVVYSVHFYDPPELTALAAYRSGLDRATLTRLPFPASPPECDRVTALTGTETAGVVRFYCAQHWDAERVAAALAPAANWARRHHATVLLGEFGATAELNRTARLAWLRSVRQAAEANGMGWTLWGYDDVMGFDLPRPPGPHPRLDPAVLQALGLAGSR